MALPRALARPRAVIQRTFNTTADIVRLVQVRDSQGGHHNTYTVVASYPCSFSRYPVRPVEREAQPRVQAITQWQFVFAWDTEITSTDRIVCDGRTFEVIDAGIGSGDLARRVICLEIV
jgi:head-tail adaptor